VPQVLSANRLKRFEKFPNGHLLLGSPPSLEYGSVFRPSWMGPDILLSTVQPGIVRPDDDV
jgi:hypothetical protein